MEGRDLYAKHLLHWLKVDSKEAWSRLYQATTISNVSPGGPLVNRALDNPTWSVPFHHSANLLNMPQAGMFRKEDGTLQVPKSDCTLAGTPLIPEGDPEDMLDPPLLTTPWSENKTQLMFQLFPRIDSLCLNFGRTGVFQWNDADSSTLRATTEWPQRIAGDLPRRFNQGGIESTRIDPSHECHTSCFDTWALTLMITLTVAFPRFKARNINSTGAGPTKKDSNFFTSYHTYTPAMGERIRLAEQGIYNNLPKLY